MRRTIASWLGVVVLAFNLLAGLALPADAPAGDSLEICTAHGPVFIDQAGHPVPSPQTVPGGVCVFCLPLMHAGAAPPPLLGFVIQRGEAAFLVMRAPATEPAPIPVRLATAAHPRAPPAA